MNKDKALMGGNAINIYAKYSTNAVKCTVVTVL